MAADLVGLLEAVAERIDFIAPGMAGWDDMTEGKICRKAAREIAELRDTLKQRDENFDAHYNNLADKYEEAEGAVAELRKSNFSLLAANVQLGVRIDAAEKTIVELRQRERALLCACCGGPLPAVFAPVTCEGCPSDIVWDSENRSEHPDYDHDFQPEWARAGAILDKAPLEQAAAHLTACAGLA